MFMFMYKHMNSLLHRVCDLFIYYIYMDIYIEGSLKIALEDMIDVIIDVVSVASPAKGKQKYMYIHVHVHVHVP